MGKNYEEWSVTANLASLELDTDETKILARSAEKMRQLFLTMSRANVDDLEPTSHAFSPVNRLREDQCLPFQNFQQLIDAAPESEDDFFLIPNVL